MAEIDRTVEVLSSLPIGLLTEDWVKSVWDGDFTEIEPLPEDTIEELQSDGYYSTQLGNFNSLLSDWLVQKEVNTGEGFWTVLVENDISIKTVLALLAYLIETGSKISSSSGQRLAAILSATSYFKLVTVPGSGAFKVYSPELFIKAVDVFKLWNSLGTCKRKRSSISSSSQNQSSQRGRKKARSSKRGRKKSAEDTNFNISEFPENDDDEGMEEEELSSREVSRFQDHMKELLQGLVDLLETFSLKSSESTAHHTIMVLAEITRMDGDRITTQFGNWPRYMSPACLAYKGLTALCSPLHGHVVSMTTATFKYLLQNVLMLIGNNKSVVAQNIPRPVLNTRDNAVDFIRFIMKEGGERIVTPYMHLIQHLCTKVPDKSEYRGKVAQTVVTLLDDLPDEAYVKMMEWNKRLGRHQKINNRVIALDVVSLVLASPQRHISDELPADQVVYTTHRFLVILLISRCSDIAPTVRTRAISAFAQLLTSGDGGIISTLREMVTPKVGKRQTLARVIPTPGTEVRTVQHTDGTPTPQSGDSNQTVEAEGSTAEKTAEGVVVDSQVKTPFNCIELTPGFNPNLIDDDGVISMLRRRSQDMKVNVRKAALQALECMIRFEAPDYRKEDLKILEERCSDPALSVRKQAMACLTDLLLQYPTDTKLQSVWLDGVLPLVMDRESTLQDKCIETLEEIILHNVAPYDRSREESHQLVWSLLNIMTKCESLDLRRYLQRACQHWSRQGKLKKQLFSSLQSHLGTENNKGAWLLLAEIATSFPKMNQDFLLKYWQDHSSEKWEEDDKSTWPQVIAVIGCLAKHLPAEKRTEIAEELKERLKKFDSSPTLIATIINTLSKLCEAGSDENTSRREKESWCGCLLNACDEYLSSIILNEDSSSIGNDEEDQTVKYLFTLGEIAQLCPAKTPKRVFMLVQSLIAAPCITDDSGSQDLPCTQTGDFPSSQATTVFSQPLSQFRGSKMSGKIRAHAFITLGKLCLQNENLAKKCIAALARELETSNDPNIRNNVIVIMCDLCVRYTTLVDRYVSNIAACLKDPSPLVRKQTLTLMTRLLQEDFLKWKGVLFFRYVTTLLDDNIQIRDFAEFCLIHLLLQRQPTMFFHHFVECIYHFNCYQEHSVYNKFTQSDREKQMFSLQGKQNSQKRLKLYLFMLEHMTDEHRFQLSAKLCQDILGSAVDGVLPLEGESTAVIEDALAILGSKEIKLSSMKVRPHDDVAEEQDMAAVVMATAKKTLITQVLKKNVIENIVPIVTSLKKMLEKRRSPVIRYLMLYLRELMKDYKNEVKEILSADKQLATEIEYDLRMFEEQQAAAEKRRLSTTPVNRNIQALEKCFLSQAYVDVVRRSLGSGFVPDPLPMRSSRYERRKTMGRVAMSPGQGSPRPGQSPTPNSPAQVRSPVPQGQEKSPAPEAVQSPTPRQVDGGSPKPQTPTSQGTPRNTSLTKTPDRQGTPARGTPLSTLAILNSARKALSRNAALREERNSPKPKEKTRSRASERNKKPPRANVQWSDKDGGELHEEQTSKQTEEDSENMKTPPRRTRKSSRAISTPSVHLASTDILGNITFAGEQNITLIPPSPIPTSVPVRVYPDSEDTTPTSPQRPVRNKDTDNLVYMFSPDKPAPKPKPWNVRPLAKTAAKMGGGESNPSDIEEADEETQAEETSVSTRSRRPRAVANTSTRRSTRSKR